MNQPILYLGDTSLTTAACYLAGCLTDAGFGFDYVPSDERLNQKLIETRRSLLILSDYPAANVSFELQETIVKQVNAGMGLLIIGGWESFQGSDGNWADTPIASILPVKISQQDDRQNCDQPVFARPLLSERVAEHPILSGLPWLERPPLIGGYNLVQIQDDADLLLSAERYDVSFNETSPEWKSISSHPLLVIDDKRAGRVATLMTDLAPHWVGPMVDWGDDRVRAQATDAEEVEVGAFYARFVRQLISWVGRLEC